jgi:hypothetical protein
MKLPEVTGLPTGPTASQTTRSVQRNPVWREPLPHNAWQASKRGNYPQRLPDGIADFGMAIKLKLTSPTPYTMRGGAYELAGDRR